MNRKSKIGIQIAAFLLLAALCSFAQNTGGMLNLNQTWTGNNSDANGTTRTVYNLIINGTCTGCAGPNGLTIAPSTLTFGSYPVGGMSPPSTVTLTNTGAVPITFTSFGFNGANFADFSQTNTCPISPLSLAQTLSCTVSITFSPQGAGGRGPATLNIVGSVGGTVTVSGTGESNPISLSSIAVTPASATIAPGVQQQYTATGTFSDGSTLNITDSVHWSVTGGGGGASLALVNNCAEHYSNSAPISCPSGWNTTVGDLIVQEVGVNAQTGTRTITCTSTKGSVATWSYTTAQNGQGATAVQELVCYGYVTTANTGDVIEVTASGAGTYYASQAAQEVSHPKASSPLDGSVSGAPGSGGAANITSVVQGTSLSTSGSSDFCVAGTMDGGVGSSYSFASGFSSDGTSPYASASEYQLGVNVTTFGPTFLWFSNTSSATWAFAAACFQSASSSAVATISNAPGSQGLLSANAAGSTTVYATGGWVVQSASKAPVGTSQTSVAVPLNLPQQSGDLNLLVIGWDSSTGSVSGVTDSSGNSYSQFASCDEQALSMSQDVWYANGIAAATSPLNSVTVAFSGGGVTNPDVRILEYRGLAASTPADICALASGTSANPTASITTVNATDQVVASAFPSAGGSVIGATAPFVSEVQSSGGSNIQDYADIAAGAIAASATLNASQNWLENVYSFKAVRGTTSLTVSGTARKLYYVNASATGCGGSGCADTNSGLTPATAWKTIQHADGNVTDAGGGITVWVTGGTAFTAPIVYSDTHSCVSGTWISVVCWVSSSGTNSTTQRLAIICTTYLGCQINGGAAATRGMHFQDVNNITVKGFEVTGMPNADAGIFFNCDRNGATPPNCLGNSNNGMMAANDYVHDIAQTANDGYGVGCPSVGAISAGPHGFTWTGFRATGNIVINFGEGPQFGGSGPGQCNFAHGIYNASGAGIIDDNLVGFATTDCIVIYEEAWESVVANNTCFHNGVAGILISGTADSPFGTAGSNSLPNNIVVRSGIGGTNGASFQSGIPGSSVGCTLTNENYWYDDVSVQPNFGDTSGFNPCDVWSTQSGFSGLTTSIFVNYQDSSAAAAEAAFQGGGFQLSATGVAALGAGQYVNIYCVASPGLFPCLFTPDIEGFARPITNTNPTFGSAPGAYQPGSSQQVWPWGPQ